MTERLTTWNIMRDSKSVVKEARLHLQTAFRRLKLKSEGIFRNGVASMGREMNKALVFVVFPARYDG